MSIFSIDSFQSAHSTSKCPLKGNQTRLKEDVEDFFHCAERDKYAHLETDSHETIEKDHGRVEKRAYRIVAEESFEAKGEWGGLKAVGMVKSERTVDGVTSRETRYYICSRRMSAQAFAAAVRGHWGIENGLHWVLDVVFRVVHDPAIGTESAAGGEDNLQTRPQSQTPPLHYRQRLPRPPPGIMMRLPWGIPEGRDSSLDTSRFSGIIYFLHRGVEQSGSSSGS